MKSIYKYLLLIFFVIVCVVCLVFFVKLLKQKSKLEKEIENLKQSILYEKIKPPEVLDKIKKLEKKNSSLVRNALILFWGGAFLSFVCFLLVLIFVKRDE